MPLTVPGQKPSDGIHQSPTRSAGGETPDLRPRTATFSTFDGVGAPPQQSEPRPRRAPRAPISMPNANDTDTQREMIPVLSLLAAHSGRIYQEGYFMLLNDINNDGKPVQNRQWVEVFASLTGPTLACWDVHALDMGQHPKPVYLNITDATFKSVQTLSTGKQGLERIIVVSTTMKNRYLLQFATDKIFKDWTAALRLSQFEHTALQEAYTGALLSARGAQLNGARVLLSGTKTVREDWCNVRFGGGMPWTRCYYILTPPNLVKDKKQKKAGLGELAFYESPKHLKKGPLATITSASSAYAVFPERAVLVDVSNLMKCQGMVRFMREKESRESQIFIMPEQHAGIKGYETLIRFIIPFLDIFQLYGRPKRLNADKRDTRSLLFAMPTLPRAYYLDVMDVSMLSAVPESHTWTSIQWTDKVKELLARKLASGYKGLGSIHDVAARSRERSNSNSDQSQPVIVAKREAPKAPSQAKSANSNIGPGAAAAGIGAGVGGLRNDMDDMSLKAPRGAVRDARTLSQPRQIDKNTFLNPQPTAMAVGGGYHERSASVGQDRNDLLEPTPYTPQLNGSNPSFHSAVSNGLHTPESNNAAYRQHQEYSPKRTSPLRNPQINTQFHHPGTGSESSSLYNPTPTSERGVYGGPNGPNAGPNGGPNASGQYVVETKPGHYSYAEYSEYMKTYLNNEIDDSGKSNGSSPNRSPPRKAVGPRPQPGREPGSQPGPMRSQPGPGGPANMSAPSLGPAVAPGGGQFAAGGPRRAMDPAMGGNPYSGNPYMGSNSSGSLDQPPRQRGPPPQGSPYQGPPPTSQGPPAQRNPYAGQPRGPAPGPGLEPAYQQPPPGPQPQQRVGGAPGPHAQPQQAGYSPQPPRQPRNQGSPYSNSNSPYGNHPSYNSPSAPGGNPYASSQPSVAPPGGNNPYGAQPQQQRQQVAPGGYPVPKGPRNPAPQQQQQQRPNHADVRQAPPMRQNRNAGSPYGIAGAGQGSYPSFPQGSRTKVNGGRAPP